MKIMGKKKVENLILFWEPILLPFSEQNGIFIIIISEMCLVALFTSLCPGTSGPGMGWDESRWDGTRGAETR